jgi:hypothetical protein
MNVNSSSSTRTILSPVSRSMRPTIVFLAVVVAALSSLAACGGDDESGTTTTSSTSDTASVVTTEPPTTDGTTSTSESTTSTVPVVDWDDGRFRVVNVAADDVLNVRDNPGAGEPIVGTLPPNGLVALEGYDVTIGSSPWFSVTLDDGTVGWVNGRFLAPPTGWEVPFDQVACTPDGDSYGGTQEVSGGGLGAGAGNVLSVFTYEEADCDRIVLVLGEGPGVQDGTWTSTPPAETVPAGTTVTSGDSIVEIRIPGVTAVRPLVQTTEAPFGFVLTTRDTPFSGNPSDLTLRAFFDANRRAAVTWLTEPARLVIDVRSAPTGTGLDVAAKRGPAMVVMPIQVDVNGPGVPTPIDVTGWARPFEAQGVAELRTPAAEPGTGDLVEATFSGSDFIGTQTTAQYPYMTTDYIESWGAFSFTIDDLAPGTYELFVGDYSARDGEPEGVYQTFTVIN